MRAAGSSSACLAAVYVLVQVAADAASDSATVAAFELLQLVQALLN
jgi:hypothetical protein